MKWRESNWTSDGAVKAASVCFVFFSVSFNRWVMIDDS
jgi:hypothetical protein